MLGITKEEKERRKYIELTKIQEDVLIGSLLGDGSIPKNKTSKNCRLQITRSAKDIKYLEWQSTIFNNISNGNVKIFERNKYNKIYIESQFYTQALPIFTKYKEKWYPNGKKIIPKDLILNDRIIAVWIADDGYLEKIKNAYRLTIATDCFSYKEVFFLKKELERVIDSKFKIYKYKSPKDGKLRYRICAYSLTVIKLLNKIKSLLIEMKMERKIPQMIEKYQNKHKYYTLQYKLLLNIINDPGITISKIIENNIGYTNCVSLLPVIHKFKKRNILKFERILINKKRCYSLFITDYGLELFNNDQFYDTYSYLYDRF